MTFGPRGDEITYRYLTFGRFDLQSLVEPVSSLILTLKTHYIVTFVAVFINVTHLPFVPWDTDKLLGKK